VLQVAQRLDAFCRCIGPLMYRIGFKMLFGDRLKYYGLVLSVAFATLLIT